MSAAVLFSGLGRGDERGEALLAKRTAVWNAHQIRDWRRVAHCRLFSAELGYEVYEKLYLHDDPAFRPERGPHAGRARRVDGAWG